MPTKRAVRGRVLASVVLTLDLWATIGRAGEAEQVAPGPGMLAMADDLITARLNAGGCETGYQVACSTFLQLQRSEIVFPDKHRHGSRVAYRWDILVPADFVYNSSGGHLRAGRLIVGSGDSVLSFLLDGETGYHVGRKVCFGPEGFGSWHSIEVQVVWDASRRKSLRDRTPGLIRVLCDGKEVMLRTGRPTIKAEERVQLALGLMGSLKLPPGDNAAVSFRRFGVEEN